MPAIKETYRQSSACPLKTAVLRSPRRLRARRSGFPQLQGAVLSGASWELEEWSRGAATSPMFGKRPRSSPKVIGGIDIFHRRRLMAAGTVHGMAFAAINPVTVAAEKSLPYLRTAQANPSGCFPAAICPTTSSVFKSTTATLSFVLTAT